MTAEEQEQRVLYTNVLEYEQDHVSLNATEEYVFHFIYNYYAPFQWNLKFRWQWIIYFLAKITFCVIYSSGLAQTVESQHKKESWWHIFSVRPRVLPAQVIDYSTNIFLFI